MRSMKTYFLITSCFFCSSDVGSPSSFWRWSYIIFSTRPRVSPSKSESLLGSGLTFFVLISGSLVTMLAHHCILFTCNNVFYLLQIIPYFKRNYFNNYLWKKIFTFSKLISRTFPSSMTQVDSSSLTSWGNSPSTIGGWPLTPHFKCFFVIVTCTSFGRTLNFTFNGTLICKIDVLILLLLLRGTNIIFITTVS